MKKIIKVLMVSGLVLTTGFFSNTASKAQAETVAANEGNTQEVSFNDLSADQKEFFASEGYTSDDTFYTSVAVQNTNENAGAVTYGINNVIIMTASTKKVSNTQASITTHITSSNLPITRAAIQVGPRDGSKVSYTVKPNSLSSKTSKTYTYKGKKKYMTMKSAAQVTTSSGTTSDGVTAGGVTLGN